MDDRAQINKIKVAKGETGEPGRRVFIQPGGEEGWKKKWKKGSSPKTQESGFVVQTVID